MRYGYTFIHSIAYLEIQKKKSKVLILSKLETFYLYLKKKGIIIQRFFFRLCKLVGLINYTAFWGRVSNIEIRNRHFITDDCSLTENSFT